MGTELNSRTCSQLLDEIGETLIEAVAVEDSRGYLISVNRALEEWLGYGPGELTGRHRTQLLLDSKRHNDGAPAPTEVLLQRRDGSATPALVHQYPLTEVDSGQGLVSVFTDPSKYHQLQQQVGHTEKLATIGRHAASVAHELNNLLTIVILQTRLLSKTALLDTRNGHAVSAIQEQAQRMSRLVDDLLAFGNASLPHPRPTDLNNLVRRTVRLQSNQLDAAGIDVFLDLDDRLPVVLVDLDQFQRICINLINNAQQAIASGQERGRLTITTSAAMPSRIQMRFADNGPGISPQILPRLFEPFFTTKRSGKGTGLGLSICAQVINDHNGRIWAENNREGGATFVLELPVTEDARRPVAGSQAGTKPFPRASLPVGDSWSRMADPTWPIPATRTEGEGETE